MWSTYCIFCECDKVSGNLSRAAYCKKKHKWQFWLIRLLCMTAWMNRTHSWNRSSIHDQLGNCVGPSAAVKKCYGQRNMDILGRRRELLRSRQEQTSVINISLLLSSHDVNAKLWLIHGLDLGWLRFFYVRFTYFGKVSCVQVFRFSWRLLISWSSFFFGFYALL